MKATTENIKAIIIEIVGESVELEDALPLAEQGVDSLDAVSIYLRIEETFGIKIPDEDLEQIGDIEAIVRYINERV